MLFTSLLTFAVGVAVAFTKEEHSGNGHMHSHAHGQDVRALQMPLRQAAEKSGIFVGAALNAGHLNGDQTYSKMGGEQYNLVTAENGCKWQATEPNENQFVYTQCDTVYNYAKLKNMTFRGHNLCWGAYNPNWLTNGHFNADQLRGFLQSHIQHVMGHYPGHAVYGWDVVNEAVNDSPSNNNLYKSNVWYPAVSNYVQLAFQWARAANGGVKLFYNDYNILMSNSWMQQKSDAVYNMCKALKQQGIIDGIGMQAHLNMGDYPLDYNAMVANFQRYASLGMEVHITELDIACGSHGNACASYSQDIQTKQAQMYQTLLRACMAVSACKNYETWGFTDKYTWLGGNEYPLPFDANFNPVPAAYSIESQLLS